MYNIVDIINTLNRKIKSAYKNFNGVYLYGSFANQTNTENSDIDLVALFEKSLNRNERIELWSLLSDLEAEYDVFFDLHPMSENELKRNPVYYNQVVNKGIFYGI